MAFLTIKLPSEYLPYLEYVQKNNGLFRFHLMYLSCRNIPLQILVFRLLLLFYSSLKPTNIGWEVSETCIVFHTDCNISSVFFCVVRTCFQVHCLIYHLPSVIRVNCNFNFALIILSYTLHIFKLTVIVLNFITATASTVIE